MTVDRFCDDYWKRPRAVDPAEESRGKALSDALDHIRRAAAAVAAAGNGEEHGGRAEMLDQAHASLQRVLSELSLLA